MKKYLVFVIDDVEPEVAGPFEKDSIRDSAALKHREEDEQERDGIFKANVSDSGELTMETYSGGFFNG